MWKKLFLLFRCDADSLINKYVSGGPVSLEAALAVGFVTPRATGGMEQMRKCQASFQQAFAAWSAWVKRQTETRGRQEGQRSACGVSENGSFFLCMNVRMYLHLADVLAQKGFHSK